MIPKGRVTVTDAPTTVNALEPAALIAVDVWSDLDAAAARLGEALGGGIPGLLRSGDLAGGWRAVRVEPTVWWLVGSLAGLEAGLGAVEAALADAGAAVDFSGGLVRLEASGPGWRELLMTGGVFDAEDPAFAPDSTAGTVLHHASVRYDVIDEHRVHILVAPSYARDLLHHLRAAAARLGPVGA
jgi:heterotetrameric sarcosine oxidase gamma subunit